MNNSGEDAYITLVSLAYGTWDYLKNSPKYAILRKLKILKLTNGMDNISSEEKEKRISFSEAMTSIEGVPVSDSVKSDLANWKNGNISFLSVFEQTLRRYGFVTEA